MARQDTDPATLDDGATPETETKQVHGAALWTPSEAPFSLNTFVTYRGYKSQMTIRGMTGGEVLTKLDALADWLEARGGGPDGRQSSNAYANGATMPAASHQAPPAASNGAVAGVTGGGEIVLVCDRVKTAPRADGKLDVHFFGERHEFPDVKTAWMPDQAAANLATIGVTIGAGSFTEQAAYYTVIYALGKAFTTKDGKQGQYKDFVRLIPAQPIDAAAPAPVAAAGGAA